MISIETISQIWPAALGIAGFLFGLYQFRTKLQNDRKSRATAPYQRLLVQLNSLIKIQYDYTIRDSSVSLGKRLGRVTLQIDRFIALQAFIKKQIKPMEYITSTLNKVSSERLIEEVMESFGSKENFLNYSDAFDEAVELANSLQKEISELKIENNEINELIKYDRDHVRNVYEGFLSSLNSMVDDRIYYSQNIRRGVNEISKAISILLTDTENKIKYDDYKQIINSIAIKSRKIEEHIFSEIK